MIFLDSGGSFDGLCLSYWFRLVWVIWRDRCSQDVCVGISTDASWLTVSPRPGTVYGRFFHCAWKTHKQMRLERLSVICAQTFHRFKGQTCSEIG